MVCWLWAVPSHNYPVCVQDRTFAIRSSGRHAITKIREGDRIFAYLSGAKVFAGLFVAESSYFYDETPIWSDGIYPHRVRVRSEVLLPEEARIPLDAVKNRLEVGRRYPNFGLVIQKVIHDLPDADCTLLSSLIAAEDVPAPVPPLVEEETETPPEESPLDERAQRLLQDLHRAQQRIGLLERKIGQLEELLALAGPNLEDYLRLANSSQGNAFEEATRKCFVALGFSLDPDFQGQSGEIDFVTLSPYFVFGECQVSGEQNVGVGIVDKLLRHRRRYLSRKELPVQRRDSCVVVCENTTEQLVQDARTEGVAILRASTLAGLVRLKREFPGAIHPYNLRTLLEKAGDITSDVNQAIDHIRTEIEKRVGIIEVLKNDRFARSAGISGREPGWIQARLEAELETHLSITVVEEVLRELTSPLVGCVGVETEGRRTRYFYIRDYDFQITSVEPQFAAVLPRER
jgi:hypothetical protein